MLRIEIDVRVDSIFVSGADDLPRWVDRRVGDLRGKWLTLVFEDVNEVSLYEMEQEAISLLLHEDEYLRNTLAERGAELNVSLHIDGIRGTCSP